MRRVIMAGAIIVMMTLMYCYVQSGVTYPKVTVDILGLGEKKADIVKNLTDKCIAFKTTLHETEESIYNTQFSLQKTPDGYELILYDREKKEIYSKVFPLELIIEPWVKEVAEGILEIGISVGSPASYTFYFRKEDAKISDTFLMQGWLEKSISHTVPWLVITGIMIR